MTIRLGSTVINCADLELMTGLGARFVRHNQDPDDDYVVMTDPEGNEFCVCVVDSAIAAGT
jgi:hypothetical protein